MITTVYDPDTWGCRPHDDPRHPVILAWLRDNGIDPADLPTTHPVYVLDAPEGGQVIAYTAFVRDDGKILARDDEPVTEPRTAHYAVPLSAYDLPLPGALGRATDVPADSPGSWWWLSRSTTLWLTVASVALVVLAAWLS